MNVLSAWEERLRLSGFLLLVCVWYVPGSDAPRHGGSWGGAGVSVELKPDCSGRSGADVLLRGVWDLHRRRQ